jgi:MIP family channel proteins
MSQFDFSAESLGLRAEDLGQRTWLAALAEGIATLLFVFIGCGAVVTFTGILEFSGLDAATLVGIALAHGLAIAALVSATAKLSGGHVNPAVTFAAVVTGRMKAGPGMIYVAAQLIGAVIGALLLQVVLVDAVEGNLGAHALNDAALDSTAAGVIVEIILTFVLVFVVFATAMDPRGLGNLAPIAIGFAVLIDHFVGVPLTGASMNPARSFGPALVAGEWDDHWVYWVGPLAGGALAGLLYYVLYLNRPAPGEDVAD